MVTPARILIVDDELDGRVVLSTILRGAGYEAQIAADGRKALTKIETFAPNVVLTDLKMPVMDGIDLLKAIRARWPECRVVVMTASSAIDCAVEAMRQGGADYLTKPLDVDRLLEVIAREVARTRVREERSYPRDGLATRPGVAGLVGASTEIQKVFEAVLQVAPTRASVVISGESGTGKELVAAAIHQLSPRSKGPFIKLHCAALAESILESELFGHARGAFTGAVGRREGRFQQADGGTLFLDEIAETSLAVQVKLLRFLQEREFEPVGGDHTVKVDVRIIAASNRDLAARVKEGQFREDLYYRLNVFSIEMPPLRARRSDVALLATHFLQHFSLENGKTISGFSNEALLSLVRYPWPGNVRELANVIERAVVVCRGAQLEIEDLSLASAVADDSDGPPHIPGSSLATVERYTILKTLESTGGGTARTADILGVSIRTIQNRLREYHDDAVATG